MTPGVDSASNKNDYQEYFVGGGERGPLCRVDETPGNFGVVQGLLYLWLMVTQKKSVYILEY